MLSNQTTQLLEEVVRYLKTNIANGLLNGPVMTDSKIRTLREVCVESFKNGQGEKISRLFATIEFLLNDYSCQSYSDEHDTSSSLKLDYLSGVRAYLFYDHIMEVSIMTENRKDYKTHYYYVAFSFPEGVHLYQVVEILKDWVPKFSTRNEDIVNDDVYVRHIATTVAKVFDTFCLEFIMKKKFRRREFSMRAIEPLFSLPKPSAKKGRENKPSETTYDMKKKVTPLLKCMSRTSSCDSMLVILEFQVKDHPIYDRLNKLFRTMTDKPCESARLFAIIHDLLISVYACKISTEESQWPGGPAYDGNVYDMFYSKTIVHDSVSVNEQQLHWHVFQISLLTNGKEFYICVRFSADVSKKCLKKIVKTLVPSFDPADSDRDRERITNLTLWLSGIIDRFIEKVITGSYHSANPSFVSSIEGSEDEMT